MGCGRIPRRLHHAEAAADRLDAALAIRAVEVAGIGLALQDGQCALVDRQLLADQDAVEAVQFLGVLRQVEQGEPDCLVAVRAVFVHPLLHAAFIVSIAEDGQVLMAVAGEGGHFGNDGGFFADQVGHAFRGGFGQQCLLCAGLLIVDGVVRIRSGLAGADQRLDGIEQAAGDFFRIHLECAVGDSGLDLGDLLGVEAAAVADLGFQRLVGGRQAHAVRRGCRSGGAVAGLRARARLCLGLFGSASGGGFQGVINVHGSIPCRVRGLSPRLSLRLSAIFPQTLVFGEAISVLPPFFFDSAR
ncbi:conserved hypothetical protein [Ricinus communis]|uniref:Uncharacterized protein n=1 Tax=Ricinus communis TaxID=3988 RepID=B9TG50_RICCO|nr:conserved hypothetical protein [Ricinus communis]